MTCINPRRRDLHSTYLSYYTVKFYINTYLLSKYNKYVVYIYIYDRTVLLDLVFIYLLVHFNLIYHYIYSLMCNHYKLTKNVVYIVLY